MRIGIGLSFADRRRSGLGAIITAVTSPSLSALAVGDTPADGYTAGSYTSTAGTIASAVETYIVDDVTGASDDVLTDQQTVRVSVLVTDSEGNTATFSTGTETAVYAAPVATGGLADVSYNVGAGDQTVATAGDFTGSGLTYTVNTLAGVSINASTGVVTISTDAALSGTITVTATNSGGFDTTAFGVTITAASVEAPELTAILINSAADPDEFEFEITNSWTGIEWLVSTTASYASVAAMDTAIAGAAAANTGTITTDPTTLDLTGIADGDYYFHAYATDATNGDQTGAPVSEAITLVTGEVVGGVPSISATTAIIDDSTQGTSFTGTSFTPAAGNDRVIVFLAAWRRTGTSPTSVTLDLGAQSATQLLFETGQTVESAAFYIREADIPTGSQSPVLTSDQNLNAVAAWAFEIEDADQTAFGDTFADSLGSGATTYDPDIATTAANSLMLSLAAFRGDTTTGLPMSAVTNSGTITNYTAIETAANGADVVAAVASQEVATSGSAITHTFTKSGTTEARTGLAVEVLAV